MLFEENSILLLPERLEASGAKFSWGEVSQESQKIGKIGEHRGKIGLARGDPEGDAASFVDTPAPEPSPELGPPRQDQLDGFAEALPLRIPRRGRRFLKKSYYSLGKKATS